MLDINDVTKVALGVFVTIEVGYLVKIAVCTIGSRLFRSKIHLLQPSTVYGICSTRDVDFMLNHINNARFLRAMDFGRVDHIARTRLYKALFAKKAQVLVASSTIRYRKPIYIFMPYSLVTRIVYWDATSLYYEQNFSTVHDKFLRATSYVKVTILGATIEEVILATSPDIMSTPPLPVDLESWIQYNELNSQNLMKLR